MKRNFGAKTVFLALFTLWTVACAHVSFAQENTADIPASRLPGPAQADTVRTNLWLTQALMGEIVSSAVAVLPPPPRAVLLVDDGGTEQDELFGGVAAEILGNKGYDLYVPEEDSPGSPQVDFVFRYKVMGVELAYPEVGRTLGIWQRWVAREVAVTASVEVVASPGGQLLFKDVVKRGFGDRVDKDDFADVESDLYEFTTADLAGSGWQNRMEEVVVLGTLVGLIAIYFANTGN